MSKLLLNKAFSEHHQFPTGEDISAVEMDLPMPIHFKNLPEYKCVDIKQEGEKRTLFTNYYIGTDWLLKNNVAIYISPKLNDDNQQTDYLKMLFSCLRHSEVANFTKDLYEIKFDEPQIEIEQKKDLLTPLLIVHFLQLLKTIVRKSLKKSYYKIEKNLNSKIKGKVLVSQTLKQNIIKNKPLNTFCQYDEFGYNGIENRILKHTLIFVQKYLALFPDYSKMVSSVINYCFPAFHEVDENIEIKTILGIKENVFYKEYSEAIRIANLILKRFGYNIKGIEAEKNKLVSVPPFWIDMSKLFELYVLGLLKDTYHNNILFQIQGTYGQPDFALILEKSKMIIDTKYKKKYQEEKYIIEDIRQLSGYARDTKILSKFGFKTEEEQDRVLDCLIIYPDQDASEDLNENLTADKIEGFIKFYKMPIKLPVITV